MPHAQIRDIDLYYEITGEGEPLVLVHGGFLDHQMWMFVVPILAESFRVVTLDWRGHGLSAGDIRTDPLQAVDDLAALVEHLDLAPAHFAGQSAGGQMLLHLAARRPELVRSLSLHEPGSFSVLRGHPLADVAVKGVADATELLRAGQTEAGLRSFLAHIGGDWSLLPPSFQAIFLHNAHNYTGDWSDDPSHPVWTIDEDALRGLRVPVQLTTGDKTPDFFSAITDRLAALIPESRVDVIEGAGHGAMLDRPMEYEGVVSAFIEELEERWVPAPSSRRDG